MYCTNCGRELPANSLVCPYCGREFNQKNQKSFVRSSFEDESESEQTSAEFYNKKIKNGQFKSACDILDPVAIVSLAAGIISFFTLPLIVGSIAIIASNRVYRKNKWNPLAKAGRILGIISFILGFISLLVVIVLGGSVWNYFLLALS